MSNLIVVGFKKDMFRASTLLNKLIDMDLDWVVDLRDAVAVYRDYSGRLRVDQSYRMTTGEGASWGALFGSLIGATLGAIAIPFTAGPAQAPQAPWSQAPWAVASSAQRAARSTPIGGRTSSAFLKTLSKKSAPWFNRVIRQSLPCCAQLTPSMSRSSSVATAAPSSTPR